MPGVRVWPTALPVPNVRSRAATAKIPHTAPIFIPTNLPIFAFIVFLFLCLFGVGHSRRVLFLEEMVMNRARNRDRDWVRSLGFRRDERLIGWLGWGEPHQIQSENRSADK